MTKNASSFSQVEAEVVNQMEKDGEFTDRGDPHARKASTTHEINELMINVSAMLANERSMYAGAQTVEQCQANANTFVGNALTLLVRYCALRDVSAVQAFGKVNAHLL